MFELDEVVQEFLVESHENLDQLDRDLLALAHEPGSTALLAGVCGTVQALEGASGCLAFPQLEALAHGGESLLARLRDGELLVTTEMTSVLLALVDAVRGLLASIEATGTEGTPDHGALLSRLEQLRCRAADVVQLPDAPALPATSKPVHVEAGVEEPDELLRLGQVLVDSGAVHPEAVLSAVLDQSLGGDSRRLGEILVSKGAVDRSELDRALEAQGEVRHGATDRTVRVDVGLLDALMTLVGELGVTRDQIARSASARADTDLLRALQRLDLITGALQERVRKTSLQPIDRVWSKVPRVVRDLSRTCGKRVRVEMEGRDTEIDRRIVDATRDSLTHLVRHAVDHAVETPAERVAAGKEPEGLLLLRAWCEQDQVTIEITDDGRGIDPAVVGRSALEQGLLTAEQLAALSPREVAGLVLSPGLATAAPVTGASGRGVGLDVVRTGIRRIGGTVDVASTPGRGTTFRITIPLMPVILAALTVTCAGDRYAVPQVSLVEIVRCEGEAVTQRIARVAGAPAYRLRDSLLPLVHLDREPAVGRGERGTARDRLCVLVLQVEDRQLGLVVDDVLGTEEVVVGPLPPQLTGRRAVSGATVLGDGAAALVLDVPAVARWAGVLVAGPDRRE